MEELIKQVSAKAGISEDQARSAVSCLWTLLGPTAGSHRQPARKRDLGEAAVSAARSVIWRRRLADYSG